MHPAPGARDRGSGQLFPIKFGIPALYEKSLNLNHYVVVELG